MSKWCLSPGCGQRLLEGSALVCPQQQDLQRVAPAIDLLVSHVLEVHLGHRSQPFRSLVETPGFSCIFSCFCIFVAVVGGVGGRKLVVNLWSTES